MMGTLLLLHDYRHLLHLPHLAWKHAVGVHLRAVTPSPGMDVCDPSEQLQATAIAFES
jgi:hypothetical protein